MSTGNNYNKIMPYRVINEGFFHIVIIIKKKKQIKKSK